MSAAPRVDMGGAGAVAGEVAPGFEPVRDAFVRNFTEHGDIGASVCVYRHGRKVVDLTGGWARPGAGVPYGPDTLQLVFSTTKAATAVCALLLVERGLLDLDAPVARYWPEFGAEGKGSVPVRWLLTHQAGLATIDAAIPLEDALRWHPVADALAAQRPLWEPGTAHGYHALTFGWLVGEVVRRVSGRSLGTFFAEEVAGPLGLEFWIGLPEEHEHRVARLRQQWPPPPMAPAADDGADAATGAGAGGVADITALLDAEGLQLMLRALTLNGTFGIFGGEGPYNGRALHAAEVPAANGITNASSLARMYAALIGEVGGVRILAPSTVEVATTPAVEGPDRVLLVPTTFGLGLMCDSRYLGLLGPGSFGHGGAGGSLGFADPASGVSFGYVMNQMRFTLSGDDRTAGLIGALRASLASLA